MTAQELKGKLEAALSGLPHAFTYKNMFGGIGIYADGKYCISLSNVGLALKLSPADRERLLELGGKPLQYEPNSPPSKQYVIVPDSMLDEPDTLREWVKQSLDHVL